MGKITCKCCKRELNVGEDVLVINDIWGEGKPETFLCKKCSRQLQPLTNKLISEFINANSDNKDGYILIDLATNLDDCISLMDSDEKDDYKDYCDDVIKCSLDDLDFDYEDIRKDIQIIDDGGDFIILNDGRIFNVCWRCNQCRVWIEDDNEMINLINNLVQKGKKEFNQ